MEKGMVEFLREHLGRFGEGLMEVISGLSNESESREEKRLLSDKGAPWTSSFQATKADVLIA